MTRFRDQSLGHYVFENLMAAGANIEVFWGDITKPEMIRPEDMLGFDRIVNLAGITLNQPIDEFSLDDTEKVLMTNVAGAMQLTSKYSNSSSEPRAIFHIGSIGGRKVMTNCSAYSASKAALDHYVHCAAYEAKTDNMAVISIDPPNLLDTPMTRKVQHGLRENRGMSQEQINAIYAGAAHPKDVGAFIADMVMKPYSQLRLISGENIVLGQSDHR